MDSYGLGTEYGTDQINVSNNIFPDFLRYDNNDFHQINKIKDHERRLQEKLNTYNKYNGANTARNNMLRNEAPPPMVYPWYNSANQNAQTNHMSQNKEPFNYRANQPVTVTQAPSPMPQQVVSQQVASGPVYSTYSGGAGRQLPTDVNVLQHELVNMEKKNNTLIFLLCVLVIIIITQYSKSNNMMMYPYQSAMVPIQMGAPVMPAVMPSAIAPTSVVHPASFR
jgi:hypothetical protein